MGGDSSDLRDRLQRFRADGSPRARSLKAQAASWGGGAKPGGDLARLLASAWPDQVARKRPGSEGSYLLASGRAATVPATDGLAKSDWLVIAELGGAAREPRITLALPLTEAEALASQKTVTEDRATFDPKSGRFTARRVKALGAIVLSEAPLAEAVRRSRRQRDAGSGAGGRLRGARRRRRRRGNAAAASASSKQPP
jgi:ATP-dependent helicase HrpB